MGSPAIVPLQPVQPLPRPTAPPPDPGASRWERLRHRVRVLLTGGRRGTTVAVLCVVLAVPAAVGAWALSAPAGAVGHDVSYPQCGTSLPSSGTFGVVGVNGGRVSTTNPCLSQQYAWAAATKHGAALYVNTGNPGSISTFYWPASGARDPALCTDRTSSADSGCAYDYGWHGGQNSLQIARNALGAGVTNQSWWLDVELANSWNGTTTANAAALQGAVDALRSAGIATVGIYSTSYQWGQITGGYRSANAATYKATWARAFTPRYPMETAPLWIAGLSTVDAAATNCSSSFTGAAAMIAQYTDGNTDGDLMCGGASSPPVTTPPTTSPTVPSTSSTVPSTSATTSTTVPTSSPTSTVPSSTLSSAPTTTSTSATGTSATTVPTTPTTSSTSVVPPPVTSTTSVPASSTAVTPTSTTPTTSPAPAASTPGAPTAVVARTHPTRGIQLTWAAPTVTGGSPVTRYYVLRGTASGRESVLGYVTCATPTCAWQDTTVTGGRVAYYQLIAINTANATGPRSVEVAARGR